MPNQVHPGRPDPACPMLAALRAGTREDHVALERQLELPGRIRSRSDLVSVLSALLASWQPLERRLAGCGEWSVLGLDPRLGEATHLLRADLDAVAEKSAADHLSAGWSGTAGGAGRQASDVPRFDTGAEAVGGRYVLLGSALGGRIIAPVVARRLDLPERAGTRFFRRDGMEPGRDWRTFRVAVAARDWSPEELQRAADAARETFAFVGRAAAAVLPLRPSAARRVA